MTIFSTLPGVRCRAQATRLTCPYAYAGEIAGSSPEPLAVTASTGTDEGRTPSDAATEARRSRTVLISAGLFGPRLEAPEARGS